MSTPNLDNLKSVRNPSPLQYAILLYGDEQSSSIEDLLDAERAAAELAAMQARIEKLEKVRKAAQTHMDFHGKPKGISKTNDDLLDALVECNK